MADITEPPSCDAVAKDLPARDADESVALAFTSLRQGVQLQQPQTPQTLLILQLQLQPLYGQLTPLNPCCRASGFPKSATLVYRRPCSLC